MRILLLAPHPFYQERGTPIAVRLILEVLSSRGDEVDVLTFREGETPDLPGIAIYRIPSVPFTRGIRPGFSLKKLLCDLVLLFRVLVRVTRHHYDVVHAVEESVFMALIVKWLFRIPYIYDMDSSLAQQMMEKYGWLSKVRLILNGFEGMAIRNARAVLPVCEALAQVVRGNRQQNVMVLHDVPLSSASPLQPRYSLKHELGLQGLVVMYVGNLERYQGIDLLLNSFAFVVDRDSQAHLVVIGGEQQDILKYTKMSQELRIHSRVHFLGPRPVEELGRYLSEADVLVSPRITGQNTPMKVYSYLQSGVPVVATDLTTHSQVMNDRVAVLVPPTPEGFSAGILRLLADETLRKKLGEAARELIDTQYSMKAFSHKVNQLYDWMKSGGESSLCAITLASPTTNPQV